MNGYADTIDTEDPRFLDEGPQKTETRKAQEWYATESQQAGLKRLTALADIFTRVGDSAPGSFRPILRCLLLGGTGVGKSTLAREFARQRGWGFIAVDCGSWLIQSAYSKPPTLRLLRDFIRNSIGGFKSVKSGNKESENSGRCCIYLDEACKMFPSQDASSGWYQSVFSEVIALADGDARLRGHEWTSEDVRNLRENCFLLCGGAFTAALREAKLAQKRGGLGFLQDAPSASHSSKIQEALPPEIYHRFPEHIVLEAPTRQDYARGIELIHEDLGVERATPIKALLDEAEQSGNGTRWLTQYLTRVLLDNPKALPIRPTPPPAPKPPGFDFFYPDTSHYCRLITTESFALRGALARLYSEYRRYRGEISQNEPRVFANWVFGADGDRLEIKLLNALCACAICADITPDDSSVMNALMGWREEAWDGLRIYPNELDNYGMLTLVTETWDLTSRVAELRAKISSLVAAGRFSGGQS